MNINKIIIKPIISEKSFALADSGKYTFLVQKKANKKQIIQAFKNTYNVDVININVLYTSFKNKTTRTKKGIFKSKKAKNKKVIIELKEKQKIADFEVSK
jgi:large subunit ribosomal protein L23